METTTKRRVDQGQLCTRCGASYPRAMHRVPGCNVGRCVCDGELVRTPSPMHRQLAEAAQKLRKAEAALKAVRLQVKWMRTYGAHGVAIDDISRAVEGALS